MLKMNPHVLGQGLIILAQAEAVKGSFLALLALWHPTSENLDSDGLKSDLNSFLS